MPNTRRRGGDSPFTPRQIPGLTLWLDYRWGVYTDTGLTSGATVGQTVKGWQDRSGNGYHATEATNPPTLAADGLTFDGSNDVLRIARMTGQFGAGYTVLIVASFPDGRPASNGYIMGAIAITPTRMYLHCVLNTAGAFSTVAIEDSNTKFVTLTTLADGAISKFIMGVTANPASNMNGYVNGTAAGTPADLSAMIWANIANVNSETFYIGARNFTGSVDGHLACTVQSILIYNRPLIASELTLVHRYLGNRHGITVP